MLLSCLNHIWILLDKLILIYIGAIILSIMLINGGNLITLFGDFIFIVFNFILDAHFSLFYTFYIALLALNFFLNLFDIFLLSLLDPLNLTLLLFCGWFESILVIQDTLNLAVMNIDLSL